MKFSISSGSLLDKLNKVSSALASNPVIPVLEDFLITSKGKALSITASNLELTITTEVEAEVSKGGTIAIPGKTLLETLKSLAEQPISIEVNEASNGITITSQSGIYKLVGEKADDFPELTLPTNEDKITISSDRLINAIDRTVFATSNDEMRQAMKGICLNIDFNSLTFAATDAHKLVKYSLLDATSEASSTIILTKKSLLALKSILPKDGEITIHFGRSKAFFSFDNTILSTRLIDAKYPDYNAVIPTNNPFQLQVNRLELLSAIRRLIVYANKSTNQVVFNIQDKSLTISSQDPDMSNEATEQLTCSFLGEPMTIGFNGKFLAEMLSAMGSENITIELSQPNKPGILLPSEQAKGESLLMLIMPILSNY
ncbi:MAG: DNA polymerase III subunit beta [Saprospiraceae bacterium]|nr:DNA polymerase III subunit beta [Saprospiraceae bacterium]MBK8448833.1 DNA polymerase III subunit beta [Saprospiraceae bacterium]MBK8485913.1 DNA polymerase III subunit beta [Saprospiraceae bacterium]MBK9222269.1 DNA polymerase III subunit beta [Saprospiraceae bacterium]MBK9722947.1 DNA polymerase III subunit beta [Saprospiraceae bacterium]